jgi:predicted secreted protein
MKRLLTPLFLLALVAGFTASCNNASKIIATGLKGELTGINCASDGTVTATWRVTNDNVVAYLFSRVSSKVFLNGTLVGLLVNENPEGIPANTTVERSGKVKVGDESARRALAAAKEKGTASYVVDTQVTVTLYGDEFEKISLTHTGTVPVTAK